jgi:AraC-like DNA-binding protein/PAS domain-containing protein
LEHAAIGECQRIRPVFGLHGAVRPVDTLDDLLGREALRDRRQLRPDHTAGFADFVACRAAGRGHAEHAGAPPGVAVGPGVGQSLLDDIRGPLRRRRRIGGGDADHDEPSADHGSHATAEIRGDPGCGSREETHARMVSALAGGGLPAGGGGWDRNGVRPAAGMRYSEVVSVPVGKPPMELSRDLQPLGPAAAGIAGLLDQIEGVQCWIKDPQGRYAWVNRGFLLNYALERIQQVIGRTDHDLSPPHLADHYRADDERVLKGEPVDGRIELVGRFDRTAVWSLTTKKPLLDGRGRIVGTVGMTRMVDADVVHAGSEDAALGLVLVHMRKNFAAPLSNAELARLAGRSVRAFERMFRRQMQATPQQFLRRLRLRLACRELTTTRRPLTAIALDHGFCDQSHFVREFRHEFGMPPGEYRKRQGGPQPRR